MSFRPLSEYGQAVAPTAPVVIGQDPVENAPGFLASTAAAFRTENIIGSWASYKGPSYADRSRVQDGWDFVDWIQTRRPEVQERWESGIDIFNQAAAEQWESQVLREVEDRKITGSSLTGMLLSGVASIADPTIFVPGGAIYKGVRGGYAVAKSAASVGAAAALGTAAQETALQSTQETRTATETGVALAGSAILGGLLGGGIAGFMSRAEIDTAGRTFENIASTDAPDVQGGNEAALRQAIGGPAIPETRNPVAITPDIIRRAAGDDLTKGNQFLVQSTQEALDEGDPVRLFIDGKYRNIVGITRGALKDETGLTWGVRQIMDQERWGEARVEFGAAREAAPVSSTGQMAAVGSDVPDQLTLDQLNLKGRAAEVVAKGSRLMRLNVATRAVGSSSAVWREISTKLFENRLYLKMHSEGQSTGPAIESVVKEYTNGQVGEILRSNRQAYKAFRKAKGKLSRGDFNRAISHVLRGGTSDIAEVNAVAGRVKQFNELLTQRGLEVGYIKEGETALGLHRVWLSNKIEQNAPRFREIIRTDLEEKIARRVQELTNDKIAKEIELRRSLDDMDVNLEDATESWRKRMQAREAAVDAQILKLNQDFDALTRGLDDGSYVDEIVEAVFNKATNRVADTAERIPLERNGPLKGMTYQIDDLKIEEFIEGDVELVTQIVARKAAAGIELTRTFGDDGLRGQRAEIEQDFMRLQDQVRRDNKLTDAQKDRRIAALSKESKIAVDDMFFLRDMLKGVYLAHENGTVAARSLHVLQNLNYMRAMGGVLVANMTDTLRPLMVHGLGRYMQHGIKPLVTNLKAMKMSARDARLAGIGTERYTNNRLSVMAGLADPFAMKSPIEQLVQSMTGPFSRLTGILDFTDYMKYFTGHMSQQRMIRGMREGKEQEYLAYLGIDTNNAERIRRQLEQHGYDEGGEFIARTEMWDDEIAKRVYYAALNKDVDTIITSAGIADMPKAARHPYMKPLFQFRSFTLAANQAVLMRGLQEEPTKFLLGLTTMTSIGMAIYYFRAAEQNKLDELSDNLGTLLMEGLDRSGMFAVAFDVNNTMEKVLGVGAYSAVAGLSPNASQEGRASKYAARSGTSALLGPTADFVDKFLLVGSQLAKGDLTPGGLNAAARLTPYASLPYFAYPLRWNIMPPAAEAVSD